MASPYSTQPNLPVVVTRDEPSMPAGATGTLMVLASGFGIGALVILFAFVFLVGIGQIGHPTTSGPTAASQSAATAPVAPGPQRKRSPARVIPANPGFALENCRAPNSGSQRQSTTPNDT